MAVARRNRGFDQKQPAVLRHRPAHCSALWVWTQLRRPGPATAFRNLAANRTVRLLIDSREEDCGADRARIKALTVNGVFSAISDTAKKKLVRQKLLKKHPQLKPFAEDPDAEVFAVKVKSLQLLDGVKDSYFAKVK